MDGFKLRDYIIEDYSLCISSFIEIFNSRTLNFPLALINDLNPLVDHDVLRKECRQHFRSGKDKERSLSQSKIQ
jgi:hypothetical protein